MLSGNIIIDPAFNVYYCGFYIEGFYRLFGKKNVKFEAKPFVGLAINDRKSFFCFVWENKNKSKTTKYVISYNDSYVINSDLYEWCDVYGGVNTNFRLTESRFTKKIVSLCPSYGVQIWDKTRTIYFALSNYMRIYDKSIALKKHLGLYRRMSTLRLPYQVYEREYKSPESNYIFHLSTLWYSDEWNKNDDGVNKTRANFIRACKSIDNLDFDGGFISQGNRSSNDLFKDCLYNESPIKMSQWIENTRHSICVFNTPAFWNCHGWKLAEYLSLGKAIISTPLSNDLPNPLQHGENIHFVEDKEEEIRRAVIYIIEHPEYRKQLERGALHYWKQYGAPTQTLRILGIQ